MTKINYTMQRENHNDLKDYFDAEMNYDPIETGEFKPRADPTFWLTDPQCRDMYVIRCG